MVWRVEGRKEWEGREGQGEIERGRGKVRREGDVRGGVEGKESEGNEKRGKGKEREGKENRGEGKEEEEREERERK